MSRHIFDIIVPGLNDTLCSFLDPRDIVRLFRTNKLMYSLIEPITLFINNNHRYTKEYIIDKLNNKTKFIFYKDRYVYDYMCNFNNTKSLFVSNIYFGTFNSELFLESIKNSNIEYFNYKNLTDYSNYNILRENNQLFLKINNSNLKHTTFELKVTEYDHNIIVNNVNDNIKDLTNYYSTFSHDEREYITDSDEEDFDVRDYPPNMRNGRRGRRRRISVNKLYNISLITNKK